jgi:hypothetical protein
MCAGKNGVGSPALLQNPTVGGAMFGGEEVVRMGWIGMRQINFAVCDASK